MRAFPGLLLFFFIPACLVQHPGSPFESSAAQETRRSYHPGGQIPRRVYQVRVWSDGRVERHGFEREYFADGSPEAERFYDADRPAGTWRTWDQQGVLRSEVGFGAGTELLPMRFWHANGQLAAEGQGVGGVRQGAWTFWGETGLPRQAGSYRDGLREGDWVLWYETGKPRAEGRYQAGKRVGEWKLWDERGVLHRKQAGELGADDAAEAP
jgi:antitoxin component YwqK of YwqJK toxin-antitoxin module